MTRINLRSLPLYDAAGARIDILNTIRRLQLGQALDVPATVRGDAGRVIAGRLVALRWSAQATRVEQRRLLRIAQRRQRQPSAKSLKAARYLLLWTTLDAAVTSREVAEYYRWRWQIELSFKRMKSILGLGHLPKKDPASARAWLHGNLPTSLLVERMIQIASFISLWEYELEEPSQPLA